MCKPSCQDAQPLAAELLSSLFLIFSTSKPAQPGGSQPLAGLIFPKVWDEIYTRKFDLTPPVQDFANMPCIFV